MRAVWSFWTEPFRRGEGSGWLSPYHAYLAWGLSVQCASRHYPDTMLVTDDAGVELLVGKLGLKFTHVSRELNRLGGRSPDWWALGKLYAYRMQTDPFVHIDGDVFLWKRLPEELETAPVFAQSPEQFDPDNAAGYYPVRAVERTFPAAGAGWLPDAWRRYTDGAGTRTASCCGIVGGTRIDLLTEFAQLGIRIAEVESNAPGWATWGNKGLCNVLIEQMMLDAVVAHRRTFPRSWADATLRVQHLFAEAADPYDAAKSAAVGYTHLISSAKRNREVLADLEARVCRDFPELAERCRVAALVTASGT
ncbi:MAG: hypothetical protein K8U57_17345 [Planctomycetes bacterium]|nr:hypothetical protein [Planctomycetota bacterium]